MVQGPKQGKRAIQRVGAVDPILERFAAFAHPHRTRMSGAFGVEINMDQGEEEVVRRTLDPFTGRWMGRSVPTRLRVLLEEKSVSFQKRTSLKTRTVRPASSVTSHFSLATSHFPQEPASVGRTVSDSREVFH